MGTASRHGEMWMYDNTLSTPIDISNAYHGLRFFSAGTLQGFTFHAGASLAIISVLSNAASQVKMVCSAHGLSTGQIITVVNSTDYDGAWAVAYVDVDNFTINTPFVADRAFYAYQPSTLKADTGSGGHYLLTFNCTCDSTSNGKDFKIEANLDTSAMDDIATQQHFATGLDYQQMTASGVLHISSGQYVWLSCKNITDTTNITLYIANMNLVRI